MKPGSHDFNSKMPPRLATCVAFVLFCCVVVSSAQAATPTWIGGAGGAWSASGNWTSPAAAPSNDGDTALFNGSGSGTVNFDASVNPTNGATGMSVTGSQGTLTITASGGDKVYRIGNNGGISIASGAGAFTFQGVTGSLLRLHLGETGAGSGTLNVTFTNNSANLATLEMGANDVNARIQSAQRTSVADVTTAFFDGSGNWFYHGRLINNPTAPATSPLALTKNGSGTLTLQVENPTGQTMYTGGFTLNAGTVNFTTVRDLGTGTFTINGGAIDNNAALTLNTNNAQAWNGNFTFLGTNNLNLGTGAVALGASNVDVTVNANTLTVGGVVSGTGNGLTKKGNGTLVLSAAPTYTGATSVTAGTLVMSYTLAAPTSASYSVASGATLEITASANLGVKTFSGAGTVRLNGGSNTNINSTNFAGMTTASVLELSFPFRPDLINTGNNPLANFVGTLNVSGVGIGVGATTIQENVIIGAGPLITRGSGQAILNIVGSASGTYSGSITDNNVGNATDGGWHINKSGSGTQILSGDSNFVRQVTVTGGVLNLRHSNAVNGPSGNVSVSSTGALQLQNAISIVKPLTLNGTGVANDGALRNVQDNNAYSGAITLAGPSRINSDSGTLTLNSATPMGGAFGLTFGGAGNISVSTSIQTGSGSVTKDGSGTLTLAGASTYSGNTTVQAGTLKVANLSGSATGTGAVTVQSGATLGGNGSVSGPVSIQLGGHLAPGNSIGTMGSGPLSISGTYDVELGAPGSSHASPGLSDLTNVTGNLTLGGTLNLINNAGADGNGSVGPGSYKIFTYTGSSTGSFGAVVSPSASLHPKVVDDGANGSGGTDGVFLDVYRLASAAAHSPEPINFGTVLKGTPLSQNLSLTNSAANDGFSEGLNAAIGSPTGQATTNSGAFSLLAPGATNNTSLAAGINTSTAGLKSGTATINLASDGTGTSGFGTTSLGTQTVNLSATVLDPASASFTSPSLTTTLNLNLGTFAENSGTHSLDFEVFNLLQTVGFTATLDLDSFFLVGPDSASLSTDLVPFSNLAPGASNTFLAYLDTTIPGAFSETYQLQFKSNGFADSHTLNLNLNGQVNNSALVPEPPSVATWSLLGVVGVAFAAGTRKRRPARKA